MLNLHPQHKFVPLDEQHLPLVLDWRNSERVRRFMHQQALISWEQHQNWYAAVRQDGSKQVWVLQQNDKPVGVLTFERMDMPVWSWGCYVGELGVWPGTGLLLEFAALDRAAQMGALALAAEVLAHNASAIKMHQVFEYPRAEDAPTDNHEILHYRYNLAQWPQNRAKIVKRLPPNLAAAANALAFIEE